MFNNYWTGKLYLKIEKESPWYVCGGTLDRCIKQILKIGKYRLTLRVNNSRNFNKKYIKKLKKVFDDVNENIAIKNNQAYFLNDALWIVKNIDSLETTSNPQVFYNKKNNSYIGYSHRAAQEFKIGDMLFENKNLSSKELHQFYANKKLRWKLLKALIRYHLRNDVYAFEDIFEDKIIGHGIALFIPFKDKGIKRIETKEEAFQAATNFAKYVS